MKSALIVQGGWEGHEPEKVSRILGEVLEENGFEVEISNTLDSYRDLEKLKKLDLIVPCDPLCRVKKLRKSECFSEERFKESKRFFTV